MGESVYRWEFIVYAAYNRATAEAYIGHTSKTLTCRWPQHRGLLRTGKHPNRALQAAWVRDGEAAFGLCVLERQAGSHTRSLPNLPRPYEAERDWMQRARAAGIVLYNDQVGRRRAA